ncbi:hypothetical protein WJX75_006160 [Coccomyxa subellipsoidea]|uniref:mannan endo-1,4-beta-mannosidase n=1 Tax=Coccomyxa subellipsoidea TaxID=248742 RepID=A0ABR2YE40_9CHLO
MCSLQTHLVAAQSGSAPSPSSTLQDVSHFDPSKYALPVPSKNAAASSEAGNQTASSAAIADTIATAAAESPSEQPKYILPLPSQGQNFVLNGKTVYFAGTNAWYLPIQTQFSDDYVHNFFQVMGQEKVTLVRVFCFLDGYDVTSSPIQKSPGVYDEDGLKRIDLIMQQAYLNNVRVIVVPTNFEPVGGGIQWYVDQLIGSGNPKELFYTDSRCKQAYKNYVYMLLNRVNTYTGVQYKNDPVMFSFELMNEPHTTDLYERNRGLEPGKLVRDWVWDMAAYVKSIDSNHMVSTGEEGYRADGPTNPPHNNWINGGFKGVDPVGNIACPNIDFLTLHVYPDNWAIEAYEFDWVNVNFIRDRAAIAHAQNKPFIIEETGMKKGYLSSRDTLLNSLFAEANNNNAGATMIWEWIAWQINDYSYDFSVGQDGSNAERAQINYMNSKSGGAPSKGGSPPSTPPSGCTDTPPDSTYTCAQQAGWGQCGQSWMQGFCAQSCGRCSAPPSGCTDTPPDNQYTCAQQAGYGQCGQSWMQGFCAQSCGRCSSSCSDSPPPGNAYTCAQQAGWGKCSESWMTGYCLKSCGKC